MGDRIDNVDELIEMPADTVVRDERGVVWVRITGTDHYTHWKGTNGGQAHSIRLLDDGLVEVLWHPDHQQFEATLEQIQPGVDVTFERPDGTTFTRRMAAVPRSHDEYVAKDDDRFFWRVQRVCWNVDGEPIVELIRQ